MASLHRSFELVKEISLVSITVNPENDTPQILSDYARKFNANQKKWHFLTGDREKIHQVVIGSFKLGSIEEPVFHSTYLVLVDRFGLIRGYYDGMKQAEVNKLFKDAAALVQEKKLFK